MDPPLVNATLTEVAGGGYSSDDDYAGGSPTVRWAGIANAYVTEVMAVVRDGLALSEEKRTRLVVTRDIGKLVQRGDRVTFNFNDATGVQREVRDVQSYPLFGTTRVWMREE